MQKDGPVHDAPVNADVGSMVTGEDPERP